MRSTKYGLLASLALAGTISFSPSGAVDGVVEINQLCVTSGCFTGDDPGWPIEITEPGSYRLTGNLDVSAEASPEDVTAILITGSGVNIDLNGFSIVGPNVCTGAAFDCTPGLGMGFGVRYEGDAVGAQITNGTVRGMGNAAVSCNQPCRVENIRALHNGSSGITVNNTLSSVINCTARFNGGDGIFAQGEVRNNIAMQNGDDGIFTNPESTVTGNLSNSNVGDGIRCFDCLLLNNNAQNNGGFGIVLGGKSAWGANISNDNTGGQVSGTAREITLNSCNNANC